MSPLVKCRYPPVTAGCWNSRGAVFTGYEVVTCHQRDEAKEEVVVLSRQNWEEGAKSKHVT